MTDKTEALIAAGYVFRSEIGFTSVGSGAGAAVYVGVTTGPNSEVVVMGRAYSSSESPITIELFEASYTGGSPARTLNRRFTSTKVAPATFAQGVAPGTLGNAITGVTLRAPTAGGSAALSVTGDDNALYLKANTNYVVRIINGGNAGASIGASFDYRATTGGAGTQAD